MSAPLQNPEVGHWWGKWGSDRRPTTTPPYRGVGGVGQDAGRPTSLSEVGQALSSIDQIRTLFQQTKGPFEGGRQRMAPSPIPLQAKTIKADPNLWEEIAQEARFRGLDFSEVVRERLRWASLLASLMAAHRREFR